MIWLCVLGLFLLPACHQSPARTTPPPEGTWADSVLQSLTLEEKVGQMMMVELMPPGAVPDPSDRLRMKERLERLQPGGVILFAGEALTSAVATSWAQHVSDLPLLVGLDAEWGAGYRLEGLGRFPDAMAIAATGRPSHARTSGRITAQEASSVGVNVLFAPTVDVNVHPSNPVIGTRSWSDSPDSVIVYAGAFMEGVTEAGLLPVMKHFPGHGGTTRDSHTDLPVATSSPAEFDSVHVAPFRRLMKSSGAAVMTAHIVPRGHEYEDTTAATFSPHIVTRLLRDSLAFDGLVFTDALNMAGAARAGSPAERSIRAILAGADVLLMPPDEENTKKAIIQAIRQGRIPVARIDSSVHRILEQKERFDQASEPQAGSLEALFSAQEQTKTKQAMTAMARDAVTVLKNDDVLPLPTGERTVLISIDYRDRNRGPDGPAARFRRELEDRKGQPIAHIEVSPRSWASRMSVLQRSASTSRTIIIADYTGNTPVAGWDPSRFVKELSSGGARIVYVSFSKPYALPSVLPASALVVQSYDASDAMAAATADVLFGLSGSSGRLPVNVPPAWPRGSGMQTQPSFASVGPAGSVSLDEVILNDLVPLLDRAVSDSAFPTAALAVGRDLTVAHQQVHGYHTFERKRPIREQDVFDLASLTKVISTTTAIMLLVEDGLVDLDRPVADYLPAFGQNGKGMVTVRDLLSHVGGLIPFIPFHMRGVRTGAEVRQRILSDTLAYQPGSQSRYSDFGPITLAWMTEAITGEPFDDFVARRVFEPLSMVSTGYMSNRNRGLDRAVPTEVDDYFRRRTLQGEVHDETAWLLGGTAGHAGLFSTIRDLTRFAGMLSREGLVGDRPFLKPETIRRFTERTDPEGRHTRALGWDTKSMTGYSSAGSRFGPRSFGHTGFTGTSFWYDPDSHLYVILLTNRVYPTRQNRKHIPLRPAVANAAFNALEKGLNDAVQSTE